MSHSSIQVGTVPTFKPVSIQLEVTTEKDLTDLITALRHGIAALPEENAFVTEMYNQLQCT